MHSLDGRSYMNARPVWAGRGRRRGGAGIQRSTYTTSLGQRNVGRVLITSIDRVDSEDNTWICSADSWLLPISGRLVTVNVHWTPSTNMTPFVSLKRSTKIIFVIAL